MEIFTSLPHDRKSTEVKKGMELEQDKLKKIERLSHARQNVLVSELIVGLPISARYSLSLSWLLNWFPRPTVKLKFVAECDAELYEGFDGRRNGFLGCGRFSISEDREHLGIQGENGYALVKMQPDQRSGDPRYSAGVFDGVYYVSYFGGNVLGDGSYPLGSMVPGVSMVSRKDPCSKRKSSPASIFTLLKETGGLGHVHMGEKVVALVVMNVIMVPFAMKVKFLTSLANRVFDGGGMDGPFICMLHMGIFCYMILHTLSVAIITVVQRCNMASPSAFVEFTDEIDTRFSLFLEDKEFYGGSIDRK
ncbi:uncharacterized protein LOC125193803 isoform X1 [Salvia hispanica]|uniref:uncharacterized protein LOC125193803 isoform X1 n=1 Tax=Salvia hispanica TaxID=49212 RepID=UPI00200970BC|nr:uncharacterized protein LOC125193803 isoform X1 [Salvia hispanica]XP_047947646.1 uncharacterized protein LOC125193803 isoform X1 [Salvia hispanica]